jgi:hypothetical protein
MEGGLTRVPVPGGSGRIKTGPMAFEGDWPGYFFRGDELPNSELRYAAGLLREHSEEQAAEFLERLLDKMRGCIVSQDWRNG